MNYLNDSDITVLMVKLACLAAVAAIVLAFACWRLHRRKDGVVVGRGHNKVLLNHDATCHGEVDAIRTAGARLGTFDLSGCVLYTTGEPCHMCLTACMWANIDKIYYGCTIGDNDRIGFRDDKFDKIFGGRDKLPGFMEQVDREACLALFDEYLSLEHRNY